jgi:hypothetical protein
VEELVEQFALDWVVALVATIVGAAWTFFKSRDLYQRIKQEKYFAAVEALEAGVEKTYRVYVQALKEAKADGKLTPEEKATARQKAVAYAQEFGRTHGIDVIEELGREYIPVLISKIVRLLKGRAEPKKA